MGRFLVKSICELISLHSSHICIGADMDGNEVLMIDGEPVGRCFRLYDFLEEVGGTPLMLADFADVLVAVQSRYPQAFECAREEIEGLAEYFKPELRNDWVNLWAKRNPDKGPGD
jgi:hypothetical protein